MLHKIGYQKMKMALYFLSRFPLKTSPPHSFSYIRFIYNKVTVYWFQLFSLNSSSFCLALNVLSHFHYMVTQITSFYCQLDYIGIIQRLYCFIVSYCLHHAATQDPGHSTKFVMLPSSILL